MEDVYSLINSRDVIRMKVPFPNISSNLAMQAHMYICKDSLHPSYGFIKCQTLKPYMLTSSTIIHYVDEVADASRNPFSHTSRIDCDKLFTTSSVSFSDSLKTTIRSDVCYDLFSAVISELMADGYSCISINEPVLVAINSQISFIK